VEGACCGILPPTLGARRGRRWIPGRLLRRGDIPRAAFNRLLSGTRRTSRHLATVAHIINAAAQQQQQQQHSELAQQQISAGVHHVCARRHCLPLDAAAARSAEVAPSMAIVTRLACLRVIMLQNFRLALCSVCR